MYNRYHGNTGRVTRMPEPGDMSQNQPPPRQNPEPERHAQNARPEPERQAPRQNPGPERHTQSPESTHEQHKSASGEPRMNRRRPSEGDNSPQGLLKGLTGGLDGILSKLDLSSLETEDILLLLILYLMYRESKDTELLVMMGAMLFT